jgi:hypothetical protein
LKAKGLSDAGPKCETNALGVASSLGLDPQPNSHTASLTHEPLKKVEKQGQGHLGVSSTPNSLTSTKVVVAAIDHIDLVAEVFEAMPCCPSRLKGW